MTWREILGCLWSVDSGDRSGPKFAPITHWHYVIPGFLQNRGTYDGSLDLWRKLCAIHYGPNVQVELCPWNTRWDAEAEFVYRFRNGCPTVTIAAYSWGAGWGAMRFARELGKRGIGVRSMVLCDPVYRHPLYSMRWLTLFRFPVIRIPENVQAVRWFRQCDDWPAGHELLAENPATRIEAPCMVEGCGHLGIDEYEPFHAAALEEAAKAHYSPERRAAIA
jgi:hypothetical protein